MSTARKGAKATTYVKVALRLMKRTPGGVVSVGQVCWTAHRKPARVEHEFYAGRALSESGLFQRVPSGGRFSLDLWKLAEPEAPRVELPRVELQDNELTAIRTGSRIYAIKLVRDRTGCSLRAARAAVESVANDREVSP